MATVQIKLVNAVHCKIWIDFKVNAKKLKLNIFGKIYHPKSCIGGRRPNDVV